MEIKDLYEIFKKSAGVGTDSRKVLPGQLFFALRGESFDGNIYAGSALDKGAGYAVVESSCPDIGNEKYGSRLITVENSLETLWELASYHREHVVPGNAVSDLSRLIVLSLTGTNGKTTTKELIRTVLASKYNVAATVGNLNNNIGVPLTLLSIAPGTDIAIVEMGASHPGDIDQLTAIAHPDYGLITNVGKAHLLGFGSFEGVMATKGELYDYVHSSGTDTVFLNADDPYLCGMASDREGMKTVRYGLSCQGAEILGTDAAHPFLRMRFPDGVEVNTSLVGAYNASNVLAAMCVGAFFGVDEQTAAAAISGYVPSNNRSMMLKTGKNTLIVDAYNANPSSMMVALDNFDGFDAGYKMALLGSMGELGDESLSEHRKIAAKALSLKDVKTYFVGKGFAEVVSENVFPDSESLASFLRDIDVTGAAVLVKGSRSEKMEKVIDSL